MQVQLLGPVRVVDGDGHEVQIGGNQPRRIVAALASEHGAVVSVSSLIDVVWDGDAPPDAHANLQTYVSRLRRAMGRTSIVNEVGGYRFDTGSVGLDVAEFDRLVRDSRSTDPARTVDLCDAALGLCRGASLGPLAEEWWARALVTRLDERRIEAQLLRVDALLALDRLSQAVEAADMLHAERPDREPVVRRYVTALHRLGRTSDALTVAAGFRRRLGESAGLEPSPALTELEQAILQHRPQAVETMATIRGYGVTDTLAIDTHGVLYRGFDERGQPVLVRAFSSELADDERFVRDFEATAARLADVEHPGVAALTDHWREPAAAYAVYGVAARDTVAALGAAGTLSAAHLDAIESRVAAALEALEHRGIQHGNVSAASVVIDTTGQPVLCDPAWWPSTGDGSVADAEALNALVSRARAWVITRPGDLGAIAPTVGPALRATVVANPYPGLRAFGEADHQRFYGRSTLVNQLAEQLSRHRWVTVVGPSGVGKSSVVVAGLVPMLRADGALVTTMQPGADPCAALCQALLRIATAPQSSRSDDEVGALADLVCHEQRVVLVIDQLEELWTIADQARRDTFVDTLVDMLSRNSERLRVVTTVRADFFDRPLADLRIGALVRDATVPVAPFDQVELEQVIVRPLDATGVSLAVGLVTRLTRDAGRVGALPLLQFALHTLFETRRSDVLSHEDYDRLGGIAGAVATIAERWFVGLDGEGRRRAPEVLGSLVVPGIGSDDTRRTARTGEFGDEDRALLDTLATARLVTVDRDRGSGEPTVTLAHESLVHHWPRLRAWIDDDRATLIARRAIADAAATWIAAERDQSLLFRGTRLVLFDSVDRSTLGPQSAEFVEAALEGAVQDRRRERRRLRRTQLVAGVLSLALIAAAVGIGFAVQQRRRADDNALRASDLAAQAQSNAQQALTNAQQAQSNADAASASASDARSAAADAELARTEAEISRIAALAPRLAESDPDLGALLAADVAQRRPNWETVGALLASLQVRPEVDRYIDLGLPDTETLLGVGPVQGDTFVVTTEAKLLVADARCMCLTGVSFDRGDAGSVALSPDGAEVVTVSRAGVLQRFDLADGQPVGPRIEVAAATIYCCGPPVAYVDDDRVAVANDATIEVYDAGLADPVIEIDFGSQIGLLVARPGTTEVFVAANVTVGGSASAVIDLATGTRRELAPVTTMARYRPDGSLLMVARGSQTVTFERLDATTLTPLASIDLATIFGTGILEFPDGSVLVAGADQSFFVVAADSSSFRDLKDTPGVSIEVLGDGSVVATVANRLLVFDPAGMQPVVSATAHIGAALLSEDGSTLVVSGPEGMQGFAETTDEPVGPVIAELANMEITNFAVSPDGLYVLATLPEGGAGAFDLTTGARVGPTLAEASVWGGMQYMHDGTAVAVHVNDGVAMFEVPSLERRASYELDLVSGSYLQFSPDDAELFVQDISTWGHLIDLESGEIEPFSLFASYDRASANVIGIGIGEPLVVLDRSTGTETQLPAWREIAVPVMLPGSGLLARIRFNDTVDLIDLDGAQRVGNPIPIDAGQLALGTVTPDGARMYVGSRGARVMRLELDPERWREMACERAGRNLTRAEWDRFLGSLGEHRATCPEFPLNSD